MMPRKEKYRGNFSIKINCTNMENTLNYDGDDAP